MSRIVCGLGSRGALVERVQRPLQSQGIYTKTIDGDYGPGTQEAVRRYQASRQLPQTGEIDGACWTGLTNGPPPALEERCLQLTSSIEGHGFGLVAGNWDGAWLTWGIIGFTLKHGSVAEIVREVDRKKPAAIDAAFKQKAGELRAIVADTASPAARQAWADSISVPPKKYGVVEPWFGAFAAFGEDPVVQAAQIRRAVEGYFNPAKETARRFGLKSERGVALCFDIHVQNGGIKKEAADAIAAAVKAKPPADERALREIIARAVADAALPQFRDNVLARKLAIATGSGRANGRDYQLDAWGLDEAPAGLA